jgi:hypothetical protein
MRARRKSWDVSRIQTSCIWEERGKMLMLMMNRSDIHFWKAGRIGPLIVESDCVLGHEAAGIVLKVGEGVNDFVVGESCNISFRPLFCFL